MIEPVRTFLVIGALFGLCFAVAEPPTRFPDESGHYPRAAKVAAILFNHDSEARDTVLLPEKFASDLEYFWHRAPQVMQGQPFALDELTSRIKPSPADARWTRVAILPAQLMAHNVGYVPQAIGFEIAMRAGGSFLTTLWAARCAGLLASLLVTALALAIMPDWARWTSVAVSLFPMAAYLRGSVSPDAMVIAATLLGIAAFLAGTRERSIPWWPPAVAFAACLYLAVVKPPYICILVLSALWLPPLASAKQLRSSAAIVAALWVVTIAAAAWHSHDVAAYVEKARIDIPPSEYAASAKLHMLITSPLTVAAVFARTGLLIPAAIYQAIGRFGLDDINPHPLLHALVLLWCAGVVFLARAPIVRNTSLGTGAMLLLTFAAQALALVLTMWIEWSATTESLVVFQGRYLLPAFVCGVLGAAIFVLRPLVAQQAPEQELSGLAVTRMRAFVAAGAAVLLTASVALLVLGEFYGVKTFNKICLHELCKPD